MRWSQRKGIAVETACRPPICEANKKQKPLRWKQNIQNPPTFAKAYQASSSTRNISFAAAELHQMASLSWITDQKSYVDEHECHDFLRKKVHPRSTRWIILKNELIIDDVGFEENRAILVSCLKRLISNPIFLQISTPPLLQISKTILLIR